MSALNKTASPFPLSAVVKKKPNQEIDTDHLIIEHNQPVPKMKSRSSDKYGPIFAKLKPGSCIRCEEGELNVIAGMLRKYISAGRCPALKDCKVISRKRCDDGAARAWVVKGGAA